MSSVGILHPTLRKIMKREFGLNPYKAGHKDELSLDAGEAAGKVLFWHFPSHEDLTSAARILRT